MTNEQAKNNCERANRDGLVGCYFPNGTSHEIFLHRCCQCRHYIDDLNNPQPGRLTPPFNCCAWGVLDRIYEAMATNRYGYGMSYHPPEDIEDDPNSCPPICKRFTHKNDGDGEFRDPPKPDCPGQMMLVEVIEPVEVVPELQTEQV